MKMFANEMIYDPRYGYIKRKKLLKKDIFKSMNIFGLCLTSFLVFSLILGLILGVIMAAVMMTGGELTLSDELTYAISSLGTIVGIAVPFMVYAKVSKTKYEEVLHFEKWTYKAPLYIFAATGIGLASNIPINLIVYFLDENGISIPGQDFVVPSEFWGIAMMFFSLVIVAPVFEEFVFRGFILTKLRKFGDVFAIVFSALFFSFAHTNIIALPVTFVIGILLGRIYIKTSNLWVCILIHAMNNGVSFALTIISSTITDEMTLTLWNLILFYGIIILGLIAGIILIVTRKTSKKLVNNYQVLGFGSKLSAAIFNPGAIIFFSCCTVMTIVTLFAV